MSQKHKPDLEIGSCPFNHKQVDKAQCPIKPIQIVSGEEKSHKVKGGCPFMAEEKKRNPPLSHLQEYYDTNYVNPMEYALNPSGIKGIDSTIKDSLSKQRLQFDQYPIYLKNTIFHDDEQTKTLRNLEVGQKFVIFDKYKEKGNKCYHKQKYEEAIKYYERALGLLRYLEVVDPTDSDAEEQISEKENENKEQIKKKEQKKNFKKQYKSFLTVFNDENVIYYKGDNITDPQEKDMYQSLLYSLYLNMSVCYMSMSHFTLAKRVLQDASNIHNKSSILLFRQSQTILYNKLSTYQDLLQAQELNSLAIEIQKNESIFKKSKGMLKMLGIDNAQQIYQEQKELIIQAIKRKQEWIKSQIEPIFEREIEMEEIEKQMIQEGKVPYEDGVTHVNENDEQLQFESEKDKLYRLCLGYMKQEHQEYEIVKEMINKYYRIIEYYSELNKYDQIEIAKKELQRTLETYHLMEFYLQLDFIDYENNQILKELRAKFDINLKDKKIIRRLIRLIRQQVTDLFGEGKFNFQVFECSMKDYYQKKKQQEKKEQPQNESTIPKKGKSHFLSKTVYSTEFWIQMFILILVMLSMYYFGNTYFSKLLVVKR